MENSTGEEELMMLLLMMMIATDGGIPILLYTRLFCCIVPDTMAVVDGRDMGLGPSRLASG